MPCSAIYVANNNPSTINLTAAQPTAGLGLGSTIRRFGPSLSMSGNDVLVQGSGYYKTNASVTITSAVAGVYTISLLDDGAVVTGATQSVTAAADDTISFNIPAIVRIGCCATATLSLAISTTATLPASVVVNNVGFTVEKL